jgi:hypothetical protein
VNVVFHLYEVCVEMMRTLLLSLLNVYVRL